MIERTIHQHPEHLVAPGQTLMVDGDPYIAVEVAPVLEHGYFIDFGRSVEPRVVKVTLERYDGFER